MSEDAFITTVIQILAQHLDVSPDQINLSTRFAEDLGAEELDQAEIVLSLESDLDVNIPDDSERRILSVGDCVLHLAELKGLQTM